MSESYPVEEHNRETSATCGSKSAVQRLVMMQVPRLVAKGMTETDARRMMALLTEGGSMTGYADDDTDLAYEYHCQLCDEDYFTHAEISEIADWEERMRALIAS